MVIETPNAASSAAATEPATVQPSGGLCIPPLSIGSVPVATPLFLAPMAGVTDRDFRLIIRRLSGVGVVTMEFISSRAIVDGNQKTRDLMHFAEEERPVSIQIYGSDATTMADAARVVEELKPDLCDINMGCPANKVLKGCAGAALMGDLDQAKSIIREVKSVLSIPLTVKFRLGLSEKSRNFIELGRICEGEGVAAVAIHGRTAKQGYAGEADWSQIAQLVEAVNIPVIGNGDVRTPEDAERMFKETGCAGVMVGRGATRNPWIFRQTTDHLAGRPYTEPALEDRRDLILNHFELVTSRDIGKFALHKLRKFTGWYTHGLPGGRVLRQKIHSLPDIPAFFEAVKEYFAEAIEERDQRAA